MRRGVMTYAERIHHLDAISRARSLSDFESRMLERAIREEAWWRRRREHWANHRLGEARG